MIGLLLSGCVLFISADEHSARQAALADTGDTDDSTPNPYARDYDGPLEIEVDILGDSICFGELEATIADDGGLSGKGDCSIGLVTLDVALTGQADGEDISGYIRVGGSENKTGWSGDIYTSGGNTLLRGTFSCTVEIDGVHRDAVGGFELD